MINMASLFRKMALAALSVGVALAALPVNTYAAALPDDPTPAAPRDRTDRLERVFARQQQIVQRQGNFLGKVDDQVARLQDLIDKANGKGLDTAAVQAALNDFKAAIPAGKTAHQKALDLVNAHAGFDSQGKVTDPEQALNTVKSIHDANAEFRAAILVPGKALREAIRAFRQANPRPTPAPGA